jgi:predicted ATP-dependent protease
MYDYDMAYVKQLTGIDESEADSLVKYYSKLPGNVRMEAFKLQTDLGRQNKESFDKEHNAEFYYAMHLLALRAMKRIETAQATKDSLTEEEALKLNKIRIERIKAGRGKKDSRKARLIKETYFHEIKNMYFNENMSWREIAEFMSKYHKTKISHGYLQQKFNEAMLYEQEDIDNSGE